MSNEKVEKPRKIPKISKFYTRKDYSCGLHQGKYPKEKEYQLILLLSLQEWVSLKIAKIL